MRRTPAGTSPEKERWLLSELKSGMDEWDPGPASLQRVVAVGRRRAAIRRRNSVVGVLAVIAAVLLVLAFAPPGGAVSAVAGNFVGTIVGTPSPGVRPGSPAPQVTPSQEEPILTSPGEQRKPMPSTQPPTPGYGGGTAPPGSIPAPSDAPGSPAPGTPPPGQVPNQAPVVAGTQTPVASPAPAASPTPVCLLHLLCL